MFSELNGMSLQPESEINQTPSYISDPNPSIPEMFDVGSIQEAIEQIDVLARDGQASIHVVFDPKNMDHSLTIAYDEKSWEGHVIISDHLDPLTSDPIEGRSFTIAGTFLAEYELEDGHIKGPILVHFRGEPVYLKAEVQNTLGNIPPNWFYVSRTNKTRKGKEFYRPLKNYIYRRPAA